MADRLTREERRAQRAAAASPITLAIEVSNPSADPAGPEAADPLGLWTAVTGPSVAIARGFSVIDQEPVRAADSRHDDDLMPAIDRVMRRASLAPADLERVAVSVGPGGFTGLRVAVATAKAIGEAIIARRRLTGDAARVCIGVPSDSVAAFNCSEMRRWRDLETGPLAVALASKRETAWLTVFDEDSGGGEGRLATAADLDHVHAHHGVRLLVADRFLPASWRDRASALGIEIVPPVFSAAACARLAWVGVLTKSEVDPASLQPIYPREPEAVTKWRELGKGNPEPRAGG